MATRQTRIRNSYIARSINDAIGDSLNLDCCVLEENDDACEVLNSAIANFATARSKD
jgi:hypothetical protein